MNLVERTLSEALAKRFPDQTEFYPKTVTAIAEDLGIKSGEAYKYTTSFPKVRRGLYNLEAAVIPFRRTEEEATAPKMSAAVSSISNDEVFVPDSDPTYVPWGNYKDIESIIRSGVFYPTYVTGLSGNGKTFMIEQACARLNREYVRVQITPETDEDDLIGGFRLINGETVFAKGPVIKAMEAGAILLIDEIDRGSNKIMALQGVLEGKPVMIKKTGQVVKPKAGFNVIATANTKGKGSEDGRFIAATIIDEAFLERFTITVEQPYPTAATERKILNKHMDKFGVNDTDYTEKLVTWAETIRKTYEDGGVEEIVSTRRLCHIVQSFAIFKDKMKAIQLCVNRFDEDTKEAFLDLYTKVDATVEAPQKSIDDVLNEAINDN
jgi:MoxR-like ATPase